jgi:hypothetical protein
MALKQRQRPDGVFEAYEETTGVVSMIFRPGTDTDWVPVAQASAPAVAPAPYREVDPREVAAAQEEAETKRYGDAPPLLKIEKAEWVFIAPPAAEGSFFLKTIDHWGFTEQKFPLQCPKVDNLPCPLCAYVEALEAADAKGFDEKIGALRAKDTYRYLVLPMDEQGNVKVSGGFRYVAATNKLNQKLLNVIGRTPGILVPRSARPVQIIRTKGARYYEYDVVAYHETYPWPTEAMALLQSSFYDLRRMKEIRDYGELKTIVEEAIASGRIPALPHANTSTRVGGFGAPVSPTAPAPAPAAPAHFGTPAAGGFAPPTPAAPSPGGFAPPATPAAPGFGTPPVSAPVVPPSVSPTLPAQGGFNPPPAPNKATGENLSKAVGNLESPPDDDGDLPF